MGKEITSKLTVGNIQHCGVGTPSSCFALANSPKDGWNCLLTAALQRKGIEKFLELANKKVGDRLPVQADGTIRCPKGLLPDVKS